MPILTEISERLQESGYDTRINPVKAIVHEKTASNRNGGFVDQDNMGSETESESHSSVTVDPHKIRQRHRRLLWRVMIFALPVGLILAISAAYVTYFSLDLAITQELQEISNPIFRGLMIGISWFGNNGHGVVLVVLITILLLSMRLKTEAGTLLLGAALGETIDTLIKIIVGRPRPTVDLVSIYTKVNGRSFPSGHVFHYVTMYGLLFYLTYVLMPRSWLRTTLLVIFGLLISLVGISRMYLGAHWASDVLGAYIFGSVWLFLMIDFYWHMKIRQTREEKAEQE